MNRLCQQFDDNVLLRTSRYCHFEVAQLNFQSTTGSSVDSYVIPEQFAVKAHPALFEGEGVGRGRGWSANGFKYCLVEVKWRSSRGTCAVCHPEILFLNKRAEHIDSR